MFTRVFISYSHRDRDFVDRLAGDLKTSGVAFAYWLTQSILLAALLTAIVSSAAWLAMERYREGGDD